MHDFDKKNIWLKMADFIVKKRWWFIGLFIVMTIVSCCTIPLNKVNYDLSQYLPKNSDTNKALTILHDDFNDKGMLYVLVENLSEDEIATVSSEIKNIDGVANVVYDPRSGYKNGNVLLTVTFDDYDATERTFDTTERLEEYLSDKTAYMTGQSAYTFYTRAETVESILKIGIVIVVVILVMLFFTSRTYFELIPMILVFGVSVALNMGTNYWFNGISYISNLVALVLQLALSIDYSVILLHRFIEEKDGGLDAKQAATVALSKGATEILSSSLTTIAGLASLLLMTLPIGVEIGLALAKSIVCSLISVLFLMPALLVICQKPLEKTKHKSFVPNVTKPARAIIKARKIIVPLFLIIIILSGVGQFYNVYAFNMNGGSKIVVGQQAVKNDGFGTLNTFVVVVPKGDAEKERALAEKINSYGIIDSSNSLASIGTPSFADTKINDTTTIGDFLTAHGVGDIYLTDKFSRSELSALIANLTAATGYESIASNIILGEYDNYVKANYSEADAPTAKVRLVDFACYVAADKDFIDAIVTLAPEYAGYLSYLDQVVTARDNLESEKYTRMTFNINSSVESDETFSFITAAKKEIANYYDEYYVTGESVVCYEMAQSFPRDNTIVNVCIVCFVLFILLLMFRNFALPVILVLTIEGGMWINFVIPFLAHNSVSFIGYLIISAIQMGATIDYAIVLTNRYETIKKDFPDRLDAMATAENAVFPTIITSGIILAVTGFALAGLASGVVAGLGLLMGIGASVSMCVVIFVLPSFLLLTEKIYSRADFSSLFKKLRGKNKKCAAENVSADNGNDGEVFIKADTNNNSGNDK